MQRSGGKGSGLDERGETGIIRGDWKVYLESGSVRTRVAERRRKVD
jgi:hypothetical protein